jgi:hypothetical protein
MAGGEIKQLAFSDGTTVAAPTELQYTAIDILNGSAGLPGTYGHIRMADISTDASAKQSALSIRHKTNSEQDNCIFYFSGAGTSSSAEAYFGGGVSNLNAVRTISFWTGSGNDTTVTGTRRMQIDGTGAVSIGTTTVTGAKLNVRGTDAAGIEFYFANTSSSAGTAPFKIEQLQNGIREILLITNTQAGAEGASQSIAVLDYKDAGGSQAVIWNNGDVDNVNGVFGTISDINMKENIEPSRNYLDDIRKINIVKYSLKNEKRQRADKLGVIAQQVKQVFPGLVDDREDDRPLSVKTSVFGIMALKCIQEMADKIDALEARLAANGL